MGDKELKVMQQNKGHLINFKELTPQPVDNELLFTSTKKKDWSFEYSVTSTKSMTDLFPQKC